MIDGAKPRIFLKISSRLRQLQTPRTALKILATLALLLAIVLGLARLRPDTTVLSLLPQDLPEVRGLQLLLEHFGLPDELVITVTAENPAEAESLTTSLAAHLREKTPSTIRTAPPWIENPESLAPLAAHALLNQPPAEFQSTLDRLEPAAARVRAQDSLDRLATSMSPEDMARLGYDPLGLLDNLPASSADFSMREFSSADSTTRLLYANPKNKTPLAEWTPTIIAAIRSWNQSHPQARTGWTGEPAFVHELATAMSRDMRLSSIGSIAFAAALFFLAYRRLRPLAPLLLCVAGGFLAALGLTAWIHPQLSIIGVGFAAILVGLTVDYGFLITQRRLAFGENPAQLRAATAPGIWAAAATTAAGFLTLNLSGIPGIAQLGNLVAIGVLAGAFLMLRFHAAAICRLGEYCQDSRAKKGGMTVSAVQRLAFFFTTNPSKPSSHTPHTGGTPVPHSFPCRGARILRLAQIVTSTLVLASFAILALRGFPAWETNTRAMQPRDTVAYPTLDLVQSMLGSDRPTLAFVIEESTPAAVAKKLAEARTILSAEKKSGAVTAFELPDALWPHPDFQKQNLATLAARPPDTARLAAALDETGFDTPARFLATAIPAQWNEWQTSTPPIIPSSDSFTWIARRTISLNNDRPAACGFATLPSNDPAAARRLAATLSSHGIHPASWEALGPAIAIHSRHHAITAAACFLALLTVTLIVSFRNLSETLLALATVATSLLATCGLMRVLGIDWNFLNLCAASISIATGIDYAIHMLFALRESRGDTLQALRLTGKPIALCAATTAAGFGSLATAQTPGLASLGIVCALAATTSALAALFLLPAIRPHLRKFKNAEPCSEKS